ncbi:MAG: NAD(P)H-binding protein [Microbispora sp.]|nr:NAD(P)H-binding protein [Microbispora sp.]
MEEIKVLVLGATGYIGSVLVERLVEKGHEVVALVRPKARDAALSVEVRHGDLYEPETLAKAVTPDIDVVVHAATPTGDEAVDVAAVEALAEAGARLVYTSGVWVLGATTTPADEDTPVKPIAVSGYRPRLEKLVREAGGVVVRPGVVYGRGSGIPTLLTAPGAGGRPVRPRGRPGADLGDGARRRPGGPVRARHRKGRARKHLQRRRRGIGERGRRGGGRRPYGEGGAAGTATAYGSSAGALPLDTPDLRCRFVLTVTRHLHTVSCWHSPIESANSDETGLTPATAGRWSPLQLIQRNLKGRSDRDDRHQGSR